MSSEGTRRSLKRERGIRHRVEIMQVLSNEEEVIGCLVKWRSG